VSKYLQTTLTAEAHLAEGKKEKMLTYMKMEIKRHNKYVKQINEYI
jgi:hypothetical protein